VSVVVFGSLNTDHFVYVDQFPRPGETILAKRAATMVGGKGANQAVAAARLGAQTRLIGFVGDDEQGRTLKTTIHREGVDVCGVSIATGQETGSAYVLVDASAENAIAVASGANHPTTYDWAPPLEPGPTVVLTQLEVSLDLTQRFLSEHQTAPWRILNAAPFIAEGRRLFDLANILIVNQTELAGYLGVEAISDADDAVIRQARRLLARPDQWVIVTCGRDGACAVNSAEALHAAPRPTTAVDTTGAGDCFCGALAAALASGSSMADSLRFATVAASLSVERAGGASAMPFLKDVQPLLAVNLQNR
jgi:ribokinase